MRFILPVLLFVCFARVQGQTCTNPGQTPATAFPVCGISTFNQATVPICGGAIMPGPSCRADGVTDKNPFWYKFTCFQSGTLGFKITPNTLSDDYDWELYDVTGQDPNAVYYNGGLTISSNWSGESGVTGASSSGTQQFVCAGYGKPLFSKMTTLTQGHNYILLISHFTNSQSGYSLQFTGGTANITDPVSPHLKTAEANCGGDKVKVKLNKIIKCSSIAANGSDFSVSPALVTVISAFGYGCTGGFDSDSLELTLNNPLPPGNYTLVIKNGSDANTLVDICDRTIPVGETVNFIVYPIVPTPMDSLTKPACAPKELQLVFRKAMRCTSVAADGSDFFITGPYPVTVSKASGACVTGNDLSKIITVELSQPLYNAGAFTLHLQTGSDGNTVLDECNSETPAGATLSFSLKDTVNADFTYSINYGCTTDAVSFFNFGQIAVTKWFWQLDEGQNSTLQNPTALYNIFNTKNVSLSVSNGFCTANSSQQVQLTNFINVDFSSNEFNCPNDPVPFKFNGSGNIVNYDWDFGDGGTGSGSEVTHIFPLSNFTQTFNVHLTVTDNIGCRKSLVKKTSIVKSCFIGVPKGFTPNGDGLNDKLFPMYAVKALNLDFRIFNRWGQLLFRTSDWRNGWDGTFKGQAQESGTYVWMLHYIDRDTGKPVEQRGTTVLIR